MLDTAWLLTIKIGLDPNLFKVGGLEITWHGLFTALGVVIGVAVAAAFARRAGFNEDTIYNIALALVIGGIIGARGLFVLENLDTFRHDPGDIFAVNTGGISIYGALIGGTVGAWVYTRLWRVPNVPKVADVAALGGILGMAVGRIGDIINGEHFASSTGLPWGVLYTDPNSPSAIPGNHPLGPEVVQHPAVAYEMVGDVFIFLLLLIIYVRARRDGITFFAWVFLYGLLRVFVSFLRLDDIVWAGLRTAQIIAVAAMALGVVGVAYLWRTGPEEQRLTRAERRRLMREEAAEEGPS